MHLSTGWGGGGGVVFFHSLYCLPDISVVFICISHFLLVSSIFIIFSRFPRFAWFCMSALV